MLGAMVLGAAVNVGLGMLNSKKQRETEAKRAKELEAANANSAGSEIYAQSLNTYDPKSYNAEDTELYPFGGYFDNENRIDRKISRMDNRQIRRDDRLANKEAASVEGDESGGGMDNAGQWVDLAENAVSGVLDYFTPVDESNPQADALNSNAARNVNAARNRTTANNFPTGGLKQTSENTNVAIGGTHESGNDIQIDSGADEAFVEGKEVIKDSPEGQMIFSNRIVLDNMKQSVAEMADSISKRKGEYDKSKSSPNTVTANTATRNSEIADKELDKLFAKQEEFKLANGINNGDTEFADGGFNKPNYNTYHPYPTSDGKNVYLTPTSEKTSNNPAFKAFNDTFSYFEDESLIPDYGNINPVRRDDDKISFAADSKGDTSKVERLFSGKLGDAELDHTPKTFAKGGVKQWYDQDPATAQNVIGSGLSTVDNLVNAFVIGNQPTDVNFDGAKVKPVLNAAEELETEYDVEPQLAEIERSKQRFSKNIEDNVTSASQLLANERQALSMGIDESNKLFDTKNKTEIQLRNKNKLNKQAVNAQNTQTLNQVNLTNANIEAAAISQENQNKINRNAQISANIANLVDDGISYLERKGKIDANKQKFMAIEKSFTDTGVALENMKGGAYSGVNKSDVISTVNLMAASGNASFDDINAAISAHNAKVTAKNKIPKMTQARYDKLNNKVTKDAEVDIDINFQNEVDKSLSNRSIVRK